MRALMFGAALAVAAAGCGKGKKAPACEAGRLEALRARLATKTARDEQGSRLPHTLGADAAGPTPGAVRVRFLDGDEVTIQVGEGPVRVAGELGSTDAVLGELAQAKVIELETFAALSTVAIRGLVSRLDPAVDVHLIVDQLEPPPREGVAPAATALVDGILAVRGDERGGKLAQALVTALGPTCAEELEAVEGLRGAGQKIDSAWHRSLLLKTLDRCNCARADVATAAWLYELLMLPTYRRAWLRLKLDTGGLRLVDMRSAQDLAGALETMTPAERQKGVWIP